MAGDYYKLYTAVVDFKNRLTQIFLEKGLLEESSQLDALKTVSLETPAGVQSHVHQMSNDVLLVFKLVAELIGAAIVNKAKRPAVDNSKDTASQTDPMPDSIVLQAADTVLVKREKDDDEYLDDTIDNFGVAMGDMILEDIPAPVSPKPALRKSSRTSVLNREPFVKPRTRRQRQTLSPSAKQKVVGAKKRKQGGVRKRRGAGTGTKRLTAEKKNAVVAAAAAVDEKPPLLQPEPKEGVALKSSRRRKSVFATELYERTSEGMFRCKECGKQARLQTNIRKHLRKHTVRLGFSSNKRLTQKPLLTNNPMNGNAVEMAPMQTTGPFERPPSPHKLSKVEKNKKKCQAYRDKLKADPELHAEFKIKNARRSREYRRRPITEEEKARRNEQARLRMAKSRFLRMAKSRMKYQQSLQMTPCPRMMRMIYHSIQIGDSTTAPFHNIHSTKDNTDHDHIVQHENPSHAQDNISQALGEGQVKTDLDSLQDPTPMKASAKDRKTLCSKETADAQKELGMGCHYSVCGGAEGEERNRNDEEGEAKERPEAVPTGDMYQVTEEGLFRCVVCSTETKDRSNIRKHYLKWHAGEKRYRCTQCPKAFAYPQSLKHHRKVHIDPASRAFEPSAKGYRCKHCGHVSKNRSNIVKHVKRRHLHAGEKPYKCNVCPAVFAYPRSLKRHELVHEGVRPYKCEECDKCFFDPTSLRTHSRVHTNDRPYVCQICGDRFRQNEGLKGHMRRHTGDRPYVCERCGMAFAAKRSLTRHIRVHTGERPYPCDQCVAAFADWTTLHNHKLVHRDNNTSNNDNNADSQGKDGVSGGDAGGGGGGGDGVSENKPYQCQFCGIRYRQPLSLKRHLRLHANNAADPAKKPAAANKKPRKRRPQDGGDLEDGHKEESTALHLQYRPYACQLCGEKFKHLRGYQTHVNKHANGAVFVKKTPASKKAAVNNLLADDQQQQQLQQQHQQQQQEQQLLVREGLAPISSQQLSTAEIEQAATILASVAVNNNTSTPVSSTSSAVVVAAPPAGNNGNTNNSLPLSVIHATQQQLGLPHIAGEAAVTVVDGGAMGPVSVVADTASSSTQHLATTTGLGVEVDGGEVIHYTTDSGTGGIMQVLRYPDGTLGHATALVPHNPSHPTQLQPSQHSLPLSLQPQSTSTLSVMQPMDLLENVVTVVFETNDGNVLVDSQNGGMT